MRPELERKSCWFAQAAWWQLLLFEPKLKEFLLLSRVASVWCSFLDVKEDSSE